MGVRRWVRWNGLVNRWDGLVNKAGKGPDLLLTGPFQEAACLLQGQPGQKRWYIRDRSAEGFTRELACS